MLRRGLRYSRRLKSLLTLSSIYVDGGAEPPTAERWQPPGGLEAWQSCVVGAFTHLLVACAGCLWHLNLACRGGASE